MLTAEKDLKTGTITVKLGGKVDGGFSTWAETNIWGTAGGDKPTTGAWSWAVLDGLLSADALVANTVIRQTNQALHYYEGASDILSTEPSLSSPPTGPASTIYIDATKAYKLRKYETAGDAADIAANAGTGTPAGFGILLWSGANPKTATLVITPASVTASGVTTTPPAYTVIVDWSALDIE
ncbi:MAG: hypothetical protein LBU28_08545 [Spirochaetaceae bacterium]|jgi:hypothetical protein|nr:hypothetical protein [Spirochaetaceae bacterium]